MKGRIEHVFFCRCVSAASICAKVARDKVLNAWVFPESQNCSDAVVTDKWGSGYPGDAVTKKFLRDNLNPSKVKRIQKRVKFAEEKDSVEWSGIQTLPTIMASVEIFHPPSANDHFYFILAQI